MGGPRRSMGNEKAATGNSFVRELAHVGLYKRSQGRIARQVTFVAVVLATVLGCFQLMRYLSEAAAGMVQGMAGWVGSEMSRDTAQVVGRWIEYGAPGLLLVVSVWISYRLVNYQRFADFLIAVEAEMNKVSWPSRAELFRSSLIVILLIFVMAAVLYGFDLFWWWLREVLHVLPEVPK